MDWREQHLPHLPWAPRGLPGRLKSLPGWSARALVEARFGIEIMQFLTSLVDGSAAGSDDEGSGRGHPVLVIPGFGFGDDATLPVRLALKNTGYRVVLSEILLNIDCPDRAVDALVDVTERAVAEYGVPVHVVGHSRGGMLARGLAVRRPDLVGRVIAMGSPLNYEFAFYELPKPMVGVLKRVHRLHGDKRALGCAGPQCTCPYMVAAHEPLPDGIDLVSLYSTSDGVVDWRACRVPGAVNIEVPGTHLGMGLKPDTVRLILDLLDEATPPAR